MTEIRWFASACRNSPLPPYNPSRSSPLSRRSHCRSAAVSGQTITYGKLAEGIRRLSAGLSRRGIRKGDVVAIYSPNVPGFAIVFHAVVGMGAVLTTVNPTYTAEELTFQLNDAGARLLVTTGARLPCARESVAATGRP